METALKAKKTSHSENFSNGKNQVLNIDKDVENLVDLMVFRVEKMGVEKAMESLLDELLNIRTKINPFYLGFELLQNLIDNHSKNSSKTNEIQSEKLKGNYKDIRKILHTIQKSLSEKLKKKDLSEIPQIPIKILEYYSTVWPESFKHFYKIFISAARLDFYFILLHLYQKNVIQLSKEQQEDLAKPLFKAAEEYGVSALHLDFWESDLESNFLQIHQNISIRFAVEDDREGSKIPITLDELKSELLVG